MAVVCKYCNKLFSRHAGLKRHLKEIHHEDIEPIEYPQEVWSFKCLEPNCNNSFQQGAQLINHLETVHSFKFVNETINFENMDEFVNWKHSIEDSSCSFYVISKSKNNKGVTYFKCNRSRTANDPDTKHTLDKKRIRNCKSQGLCHINSSCTSQMKLYCDNNGRVTVNFQKQHYGHENELSKLRLPKQEREQIAVKLINGIPPKKILQTISDNIGDHLKRIDLLTMTDIGNIKRSFGIESQNDKRRTNDVISLDLWIQENMSKLPDENPILLYKKPGSELTFLKKEDFCLMIMNKFQKTMLQKFGSSTVTIDGTHGLNCDLELTTLMVLDEFRQGFPVAFTFSNRKDTCIYQIFFQKIKAVVGAIKPKIFMSDLAEAHFNAWSLVMGIGETQHLYCDWHVDRAWQSNISKVKGSETQRVVRKALEDLQQSTKEEEFEECLFNTVDQLMSDEATQDFGSYFKNNYLSNHRKWAHCFRKDSLINTNMHVEAMHKVLKYLHAQIKTVGSIDKGVDLILGFLRDKSRDRIIKLVKGKSTKSTKEIFKRHCEAQRLNNYTLEFSGDGRKWKVIEGSEGETYYNIEKKQDLNCCSDICFLCKICRHVYTCTCSDFESRKLICKHIHYLIMLHNQIESESQQETANHVEADVYPSILESEEIAEQKINRQINDMFLKLQNFNYSLLDDATLGDIHHHLNKIDNLTKLPHSIDKEVTKFEIKKDRNKRYIDPQLSFHSTKRKKPATATTSRVSKEMKN